MNRKNYEKWWSENLFSGKTEYIHNGHTVKVPSIEEFSESSRMLSLSIFKDFS